MSITQNLQSFYYLDLTAAQRVIVDGNTEYRQQHADLNESKNARMFLLTQKDALDGEERKQLNICLSMCDRVLVLEDKSLAARARQVLAMSAAQGGQ